MSTTITVSAFKVDLDQLHAAISSVQASAQAITNLVGVVNWSLNEVAIDWSSPAYQTIAALIPDVGHDMNQLVFLMYQMVDRMKAAYQNYSSIELTNVTNLTFG